MPEITKVADPETGETYEIPEGWEPVIEDGKPAFRKPRMNEYYLPREADVKPLVRRTNA